MNKFGFLQSLGSLFHRLYCADYKSFRFTSEMDRTSNSANETMLLFLVLIGIVFAEYVPKPTEDYPFSLVLSQDHYTVFWKHEPDMVTLEIHATTRGWVGIGFSPNGGMKVGFHVFSGMKSVVKLQNMRKLAYDGNLN